MSEATAVVRDNYVGVRNCLFEIVYLLTTRERSIYCVQYIAIH